jgi:hypothetical protein
MSLQLRTLTLVYCKARQLLVTNHQHRSATETGLSPSQIRENFRLERIMSHSREWDLAEWESLPEPGDYSDPHPDWVRSTNPHLPCSPATGPVTNSISTENREANLYLPSEAFSDSAIENGEAQRRPYETTCPSCFRICNVSTITESGLCRDCV